MRTQPPCQRLRTLHLLKTPTGAAWALRQMRELSRAGCEVHVGMPLPSPLEADYAAAGVRVHELMADLPDLAPWRWPRALARLRELVLAVDPDLLHSHFVSTTLAARLALRRKGPPRLFQVPGPLHLESSLFRSLDIRSASQRDYWVATCRATAGIYRGAGVQADRVFSSYYGADLVEKPGVPDGRLRRELGLRDTTRVVGMVAFIYPPKRLLLQKRGLKGHEDLIDALGILRARGLDVVGVIIGGTWRGGRGYEESLRRRAAERCGAAVVFLGNRTDAHFYYPEFDVAVHPSLSENVGGAVESLMHAIPTVATDVGGLPDVVRDEETGWLVPPRNPTRLADAIASALSDRETARRRGQAGRLLIHELFDVRQTARQVLDVYRTILARETPGPR